jgi:hypothetical protein
MLAEIKIVIYDGVNFFNGEGILVIYPLLAFLESNIWCRSKHNFTLKKSSALTGQRTALTR